MVRVLFYYVAIVSPLNKFEFTSQGMTWAKCNSIWQSCREEDDFCHVYKLIWSAHQELKCHLDSRNVVISNWSSLKNFSFFFWPRKKYCLEIMCRQTSWFYFYWGFPWIDLRGMDNGGEISYWFVRLGERNLLADDHDFQARRINKDPSHRWRDKDVLFDRAS